MARMRDSATDERASAPARAAVPDNGSMSWSRAVYEWGSTAQERSGRLPCDALVAERDTALFRAVDVDASSEVVFRWLCQLRVAPYSYDLLDNRGRRSPQHLIAGLEHLEAGQRVMRIFRLVDFEWGRSLTLLSTGTVFGRVAATYSVEQLAPGRSRLLAKLRIAEREGLRWLPLRVLLPAGDLVMARRQLLNLKALAERTEGAAGQR
jgi:hypothetical protein